MDVYEALKIEICLEAYIHIYIYKTAWNKDIYRILNNKIYVWTYMKH